MAYICLLHVFEFFVLWSRFRCAISSVRSGFSLIGLLYVVEPWLLAACYVINHDSFQLCDICAGFPL